MKIGLYTVTQSLSIPVGKMQQLLQLQVTNRGGREGTFVSIYNALVSTRLLIYILSFHSHNNRTAVIIITSFYI